MHDAGLSGGQKSKTYTVLSGDTLTSIAAGLTSLINSDTSLQAIGVSATSASAVITLTSTSVNVTTYTESTTGSGMETITLGANLFGYWTKIDGPLAGNQDITTMTYDAVGRLYTRTDSEGYTLTYSYDNADRLTLTSYLDGSTDQTIYDKLDPILKKDRIGRWSQSAFDSMDQVAFQIDPLGRKTQYTWCACGSLATLTDPLGQTTTLNHDLQGRTILKTYQDQSTTSYSYEPATSRLRSRTDALNQTTVYLYNTDNTSYQVGYKNTVNPTATVTNVYDPNFNRITSNTKNDWGAYSYSYNPYIVPMGTPTTGGGMLSSVSNNVIPNSATTYSYDVLERTTNRSINGSSNSDTWTYDAMSRITAETNVLGSWAYNYVDNTSGSSKGTLRLSSINYPNSQVTNFNWYSTTFDERLQGITNLTPAGKVRSQFNYAYDSAGEITRWAQQNASNSPINYSLGYDLAGQLVSAQGGLGSQPPTYADQYYYNYDPASNRISAQRNIEQSVRISGSATGGDTVTITVVDPGLSSGQEAVTYAVQSGDTLTSVALALARKITADANLQALGVNATSSSTYITLRSVSPNVTTYAESTSGGASEVITFGLKTNAVQNAAIGGTITTSNTVSITVYDIGLTGGSQMISHTVAGTDTPTTIASALASGINGNSNLSTLGVTATSASAVVSIKSTSPHLTTYIGSTNSGATETIAMSMNMNGSQTALVQGSKTTGDSVTMTVFDPGLSGGSVPVSYTVLSGDTLSTITAGLTSAINSNTSLQAIGVSATSSSTTITLTSLSLNATSYVPSWSTNATERIILGPNPNGIQTAVVGGSKHTGDTLNVTAYDSGLSGGQETVSYVVQSSDTLTTIATGVKNAINADTNLSTIGVTATSSGAVVFIKSASVNATTYSQTVSTSATETITLASTIGNVQAYYNNVNELVALAPGGATRYQGTTNKAIKSGSISTQLVSINAAAPTPTTYVGSTNTGATETITLGTNINGNASATIRGTTHAGNVLTLTVYNASLSGGQASASYTVLSGDRLTSIATGLKNAMNAITGLTAIGLSATSSSAVVSLAVTRPTYTVSTSGSATETITLGTNNSGTTTATIGGMPTTSDTLTITTHYPGLTGGQEPSHTQYCLETP